MKNAHGDCGLMCCRGATSFNHECVIVESTKVVDLIGLMTHRFHAADGIATSPERCCASFKYPMPVRLRLTLFR